MTINNSIHAHHTQSIELQYNSVGVDIIIKTKHSNPINQELRIFCYIDKGNTPDVECSIMDDTKFNTKKYTYSLTDSLSLPKVSITKFLDKHEYQRRIIDDE